MSDDLFTVMPSESELANLGMFADEAVSLKIQIEEAEEYVKSLSRQLKDLEEFKIPNIMTAAGIDEFKLKGGGKIKISEKVQGGLSTTDQHKKDFGLEWLLDNGGSFLIKTKFEVNIAKGDLEEAEKLRAILDEKKIGYNVGEAVHAGSLGSWLKEKFNAGTDVPWEDLGIRHFYKAEIKLPKPKG